MFPFKFCDDEHNLPRCLLTDDPYKLNKNKKYIKPFAGLAPLGHWNFF